MAHNILIKRTNEDRQYDFDFQFLLAEGELIRAVIGLTSTPAGLTVSGGASMDGIKVQLRIAGGTSGTQYKIMVKVLTILGNTLSDTGKLTVLDP